MSHRLVDPLSIKKTAATVCNPVLSLSDMLSVKLNLVFFCALFNFFVSFAYISLYLQILCKYYELNNPFGSSDRNFAIDHII